MAVYAITGKLGSGKGKAAIDQIRRYLRDGKRVATNCDVFLEHLMPARDRSVVIRVPDKPSAVDLYMIGSGNRFIDFEPILQHGRAGITAIAPSPKLLPGFDEHHNGALILDECGSWLNTRNFQDKGRAEMLEWAIHARKYGWDVFFIMQNISQVDKQLRDSLLEYVVRLNRLDRMRVPVLSPAIAFMTAGAASGSMPRLHIGVVRLGASPDALVADRWYFRGDDLNNAYNTTQVFSDTYPHGTHSLLSSWHLSAVAGVPPDFIGPLQATPAALPMLSYRALPPKPPHKHMTKFLFVALCFGAVLGVFGYHFGKPILAPAAVQKQPEIVPSKNLTGVGYIARGTVYVVTLSDGRSVTARRFRFVDGGWLALVDGDTWVKGSM
ncbi:zonular occludens toxin domain-containing protein [Janthinobacterium sp. GB1R12]|uniref:zonular occludens toxin domain-containing protein n=1 Tax=Janthinobacterium sp. GB1R12 TaxID=3424190 RepID=UPI003F25634B